MISRNYLLFIVLFFIGNSIFSQTITDIDPVRNGNNIIVKYKIAGAKFNQKFNVSLYFSHDGGASFIGLLKAVSGDVGEGIEKGERKIIWDVFKEVNSLDGNIVFDIKATVIEEKIKKKFFVSYLGSLDAPLGISVGQLGKTGWYFSARSGTMFEQAPYTYGGTGWSPVFDEPQYFSFNNAEKIKRLSLTAGLTQQMGRNSFFYIGGGYGVKDLLWQMDIYSYADDSKVGNEYVKHPDYSYSGFEAEAGLIFRMKSFLITAGASSVNFKYTNWTFGLGFNF